MKYLLLFVAFEVGLALNGTCPPGAVKSTTSNVCYIFSSTPATSYKAQIHCTDQGGNLVNIDSQFANNFLISSATNKSWQDFWIGATLTKVYNDAGVTKIWIWEGLKKLLEFDDWGFNEPSNKGACGAASTSDSRWFAEDCSTMKNYVCSVPVEIDVCDDEWTYFRVTGFCYKVFYHSDWTNAESNCVAQGAHLASIHNKPENDFIQDLSRCGFTYAEWQKATIIGLYTTTNDNTNWTWSDSSLIDYFSWQKGEPGNPGLEKCVSIYADPDADYSAGFWNNMACDTEMRSYVCKKLPSQFKII